jgi:hypothetical protein
MWYIFENHSHKQNGGGVMAELISMTYEQARAEHFKALMKKMERKIDYWQYRGRHSLKPMGELSRANIECSEAGMQYNFYKDALEALENQPKWISVEERLPEPYKKVLTIRKGFSEAGRYIYSLDSTTLWIDNTLVWNGDLKTWKNAVTHWMPLPEPPKEEQE